MKPKISTGYLTPQIKKKKNVAKSRLSDAEESSAEPGIDENIFAALMKCPEKKKMILELLASNKGAIEKYKKNEAKQLANSPLGKVKSKKRACESPTALLRRRALDQMNTSHSSTNKSSSTRSELSKQTSRCSETSSNHSDSSVPFDKVLDGVIAYVEIKNRDQDRSSGAKAILKSMGAILREKFTNDVTHVIFKDGSFMTYQKAKLLKIHLVSILWVEFCRKTMRRQPEKQYPALKSGFQDNETSMICSQMQKEYEDIIRDEYRRSIKDGTPLPSTRSFIDRRRTLMTPSVSNLNSSTASFQTAEEGISSQEQSDREVAAINGFNSESGEASGEECLILNDPDCFSEVSGPMVNGDPVKKSDKRNSIANCVLRSVENVGLHSTLELIDIQTPTLRTDNDSPQNQACGTDSDMEITMILNSNKTPKTKGSKSDIYNQTTPKLPFKNKLTVLLDRRNTICNSLLSSDTSTTSLISSDKSKNASSLLSSDKSTNISDKSTNISNNASFAVPKSVKKSKRSTNSLFGSDESFEFGKNKAKTSKISRAELDQTTSAISELHLSSDRVASKRSSTMSSLQISSENKRSGILNSLPSNKNSSIMSTLQISSERKEDVKSKLTTRSSSVSGLWLSSKPKANQNCPERSTSMSDLHLSSEKTDKGEEQPIVKASLNTNFKIMDQSAMSTLHISAEDNKKSTDKSSMSTLQVSTESKRSSGRNSGMKNNKNSSLTSDPSAMSSLHLSSEVPSHSVQLKERASDNANFSSIDTGSSSGIKNLVRTVIENLQTPESVVDRKKSDQSLVSLSKVSINSDDSEILSPRRNIRKTQGRQNEDNSLKDSYISEDSSPKERDLELLSTVTKRRKTLGSRRGATSVSKTLPKDFDVDNNKELVVNILKSPLTEKLGKHCNDDEPPLVNKKTRRTLGKGVNDTQLPITVKESSNQITNVGTKNKENRHPKNASETSTSDSENNHSSNNKTKSDDSSDSTKSRKRVRKLYNPDDSIHVLVDDEKEREEKRLEVRKRKSEEGVFINPGDILKSSDKRLKEQSPNKRIDLESSDEDVVIPPRRPKKVKKVKKGNKKNVRKMSLNSSADEQKDLLEEIIKKKNKPEVVQKTPKSVKKNTPKSKDKTPKVKAPAEISSRRKSMRIIKSTQKLIDSQRSAVKLAVPVTPINRRSTLDFQPISSSKKSKNVDKTKLPTIVCTKLHKSDVQMFTQIIKKLGRFIVEDEVSNRTTHLIAGEPKRTINMLRAISRGCWVLKFEWVLQSLEAGKWLREEDFEVHDFSPIVQKCRLERQAFGPTYTLDVFESCPPIYVALNTNPRCSDLKDLITTCRGKVVSTPRMAKIIVGEFLNQEDATCVNAAWVLDCITFNRKIGFKKQYLLEKDNDTDNKRKSVIV